MLIGVSACSILQVPLRLAWALTIHKSQVIAHLIRVGDGGVGGIVGVVGVVGGGVVGGGGGGGGGIGWCWWWWWCWCDFAIKGKRGIVV